MSTMEQRFPFGDVTMELVHGLSTVSGGGTGIRDRLEGTPHGQLRLGLYGLLESIDKQIQVNPLSPSGALGGQVAPPANTLSLQCARCLGLDTYHAVILGQDSAAPILDTEGFGSRLTAVGTMKLTNQMQTLLSLMKWSKNEQPVYYGLVESASRDMSRERKAAFFLGAYVGMYVERGTEGADLELYVMTALPFSVRR